MRIDPRDARLLEHGRERREPALGLPLARVLAPECLIAVAPLEVQDDERAAWDDELADRAAVPAACGGGEWKDNVFDGAGGEYEELLSATRRRKRGRGRASGL